MARKELVIGCALIGAFGGALFGYAITRVGTWGVVAALTVCTAVSATLLGWFLARRADDALVVGGRATAMSFVAGAFNGVLLVIPMSLVGRHVAASLGMALAAAVAGTLAAIPFAPAIIVVAMTAAYADARTDSIAGRSQGRRVVRNALACVAVAGALIGRRAQDPLAAHVPLYVAGGAALLLFAIVALELYALGTLPAQPSVGWEPAPDGVELDHVVDYGVGVFVTIRRASGDGYRDAPITVDARRGDRANARALLRASLRGHAVASAVATLATLATLAH